MIPFLSRSRSSQDKHRSIGNQLTLSLFFDEHYFPHAQATKRLTHHDWSIFNTHMRASLGKYLLDDLTNPVLDVWVREQLVAGYQRSTINKHIHLMNRMLNLARHWGFVSVQQYQQQNLKKLALGDYKQRFLTADEIERLLAHCRASTHPFLYLLVQLLLLTGARVGEARTACWRDIDLGKRLWTVPRSKNGRSRRIVLSDAAVDVLHSTRERSEQLMLSVKPDAYVFTNPITCTAYHSFYAAWFKVRDAADLGDLRIHDLRHTFASLLVNKGVSLYEVQTLLGHSSVQMTQRYAHLAPDRLQQRTELVSQIVAGKKTSNR